MPKQINFTYDSPTSIDNAIKEMRSYQANITYKCKLLAERLASIGVEIARVNVADFEAIYSGELLLSIKAEYNGSIPNGASWMVITDCPWAFYVEFGTGIVGANSLHPDTGIANWKYDINQHGDMGWYYFKDGDWHNIAKYANGGLPNMGQMFVAREAGPELVGTIGGHTAVMNNNQIVASVSDGVFNALNPVLTSLVNAINTMIYATSNGNGDVYVQIDGNNIAKAVRKQNTDYRKRTGRGLFD